MSKIKIELTGEQALFLLYSVIYPQMKNKLAVRGLCESVCETKKEVIEQEEWHMNMLNEILEVDGIRCFRARLRAIEELI